MGIGDMRLAGLAFGLAAVTALGGCDENGEFSLGTAQQADASGSEQPVAKRSSKTVEKDIEAPDVFQVTEAGLWDGRPSLGGVWVAHPDVTDPERVIIRNSDNGKFVVGALFRRERDIPGPRLQISSDAAASLGMLAGAPSKLNVTALRREEIETEEPEPVVEDTPTETAIAAAVPEPEPVAEAAIEPVTAATETNSDAADTIDTASAAIDAAVETPVVDKPKRKGFFANLFKKKEPEEDAIASADDIVGPDVDVQTLDGSALETVEPTPVAAPAPKPRTSTLKKPFLQVGIFSVEANANRTADQMRAAGMVPLVRQGSTSGKPFWRVIVGPAATQSEQRTLLGKIKSIGFTDAYAVSG